MSETQRRRPTMRDVAAHVGVSFKTVSRVVNGEGGVSDDLVARIEQAVVTLGYRPDDRARRLRQGGSRTGTIGFVLVDVSNPFFSSTLRGIEEIARKRDYLVLAGSTDGVREREDQLIEAFVGRRVDGLIVVSSGPGVGLLRAELDRGTPVVFLDLDPTDFAVDLVRSDHFGGAILATEHLIARGHRDIAFLSDDPTVFSAGQRLAGFRHTMDRAGLTVEDRRIVHGRHSAEDWQPIIREFLAEPNPPTAMFTAQNFITMGATRALHELDLHTKIALIGFDDIDLADVVRPGVSVVPQHPLELGRQAAEILFARIEGSTAAPLQEILHSAVIERGSGELLPWR